MKFSNSSNAPSNCEQIYTAITTKDFRSWSGIPKHCSYINFQNYFPTATDDFGVGFLGRKNDKVSYRIHIIEGYKLNSQVWFHENDLKQILLNFPTLSHTISELNRCFDVPIMKLDYYLSFIHFNVEIAELPERS